MQAAFFHTEYVFASEASKSFFSNTNLNAFYRKNKMISNLLAMEREEISTSSKAVDQKYKATLLVQCALCSGRAKSINQLIKNIEDWREALRIARSEKIQTVKLVWLTRQLALEENALASEYSKNSKSQKALKAYEATLKTFIELENLLPQDELELRKWVCLRKASIFTDLGRFEEAKHNFSIAFGDKFPSLEVPGILIYLNFLKKSGKDEEHTRCLTSIRKKVLQNFDPCNEEAQVGNISNTLELLDYSEEYLKNLQIEKAKATIMKAIQFAKNQEELTLAKNVFLACVPSCTVPKQTRLYYLQGIKLQENSDIELAENFFKKAISEAPKFELPYLRMSMIELQKGKLLNAEKYANTVLKINPKYARGWLQLALIKRLQRMKSAEKDAITKALSLNQSDDLIRAEYNNTISGAL